MWESAGRYYAEPAPDLFQVPVSDGHSFERAPAPRDVLRPLAEADGVVAGWLSASLVRPVPTPERQLVRDLGRTRLMIDALVVDRVLWRRGIGGALLSAAESWGREQGADLVQLDTYADGPVAVPFYERCMGYQRRAIVFQKRL